MAENTPPEKHKRSIFNRENLWAILLSIILILVFIMTADSSPLWIYQGF